MVEFRGHQLDFDIFDADAAEDYEAALESVREKIRERVDGEKLSEAVRRQCVVVFDFFDDLFGDGFHRELFGERTNLRECLAAFQEFTEAVNGQKDQLTAEFAKDVPAQNRAVRRAAAKHHVGGK